MTIYVYSTLANDNQYVIWDNSKPDLPAVEKAVLIKGGANVADKRGDTRQGVVTEITEEEYKALNEGNEVFQRHIKNGFLFIGDKPADPEVVAADMTTRDESAPLVPQDYRDDDKAKPASGKGKR